MNLESIFKWILLTPATDFKGLLRFPHRGNRFDSQGRPPLLPMVCGGAGGGGGGGGVSESGGNKEEGGERSDGDEEEGCNRSDGGRRSNGQNGGDYSP